MLFNSIISILRAFLCLMFLVLGLAMLNTVIGLVLPYVTSISYTNLITKLALAIFIPISAITFATQYIITLYSVFITLGYGNLYVTKVKYFINSLYEYFMSFRLANRECIISVIIILQVLVWFYAL